MEISQGSLQAVFQGLKTTFLEGVKDAKPGEVERLLIKVPSSTGEERYPSIGLLGDLEELLDELAMTNIWQFMQRVENSTFARGLPIKRTHIEDDQIGMYSVAIRALGSRAETYSYRQVPRLLTGGFTTNWIDGTTVFSGTHAWPGGQAWSNLVLLALTVGNFATAVQNLETRVGPDGQELGLKARVLVCGSANKVNALQILSAPLVGGGDTNIHFEETDLLVLPNLGLNWFVMDDNPDESGIKPILTQMRDEATLESQTGPESDAPFLREEYIYKGRVRFGQAIVCPWLIEASRYSEDTTTTTAAE